MCLCCQAPDEAAETLNLSQKVSLTVPEAAAAAEGEAATAGEGSEEDKNLPEWSGKVASGILTGKAKQVLHPEIPSASVQRALVLMKTTYLSDPIVGAGASWLSWGLVKGAEFTGKAIHAGASKLREHITPEDKPAHVSPTVTKGLHVAKQATGGAVKVSQFLGDRGAPKSAFRAANLAAGLQPTQF